VIRTGVTTAVERGRLEKIEAGLHQIRHAGVRGERRVAGEGRGAIGDPDEQRASREIQHVIGV